MIDKMFYSTFTLLITILACFLRKKSKIVQAFAFMHFPRHRPGPPRGLKAPPDPSFNGFWLCQGPMHHIFSALSPENISKNGFILLVVFNRSTVRRQFTFIHWVPRNSRSLFDWPQNDMRRMSQRWSHPVVLNPGLDCKFSTLTINKKQNKILSKY